MDNLIKTLPAILAATGGSEEVAEAACIAAWKHAVGEVLAQRAVPIKLEGQTLTIVVQDSIWQRQLEQMRGHLLFRLNSVLGQILVKRMEFRVDGRQFMKAVESEDKPEAIPPPAIPIELLSAAASIDDAQLRRAFLGAAVSCIRRSENAGSEI